MIFHGMLWFRKVETFFCDLALLVNLTKLLFVAYGLSMFGVMKKTFSDLHQ